MEHKNYFLGIDLGSSSVKVSILDGHDSSCIESVTFPENEMPIESLHLGWAEQDPLYWWDCVVECINTLNKKIDFNLIDAIGISYQMHGLVALDINGKPVRPSIIWCDSRAVDIGKNAHDNLDSKIISDHLLNSPGNFTASKLKWVKDNELEIYKSIHKIMLPGDYIAYKFTGEMNTTESGLSEAIMWDFNRGTLSKDLIKCYDIDEKMIPEVVSSFGNHGEILGDISDLFGFRKDVKLTYRAGDQPNNAFSLNALNPGEIAATAGTSAVIYSVTDKNIYDKSNRINTFLHCNNSKSKTRNGLLLCINGCGIAYSWLRKLLKGRSYNDLNLSAINTSIGSENLKFYPFGNGSERLFNNKELGSHFIDLNFNVHDETHLIRSVQEGIAFSMCYGIEMLKGLGVEVNTIRVGNANLFLSMLFREAFVNTSRVDLEIYDTNGSEGAARAAALGIGYYSNDKEAFNNLKLITKLKPDKELVARYSSHYDEWKNFLPNFY